MKRLFTGATLALALLAGSPAIAQNLVATDCSGVSRTSGYSVQGTVDQNGRTCVHEPDARAVDQTINAATLNAAYTVNVNGQGEVGFSITGLTASGAVLTVEGTNNIGAASPQWSAINAVQGGTLASTITADGNLRVESGGRTAIRLRVSTTGTGTVTISHSASAAPSIFTLGSSLPPGTAMIGKTQLQDSGGGDVSDPVNHALNVQVSLPSTRVKGYATSTGTSSTQLVAAVAGKAIYVMYVSCSNSGSSDTDVSIQDGSGGTTLASLQVKAGGGNNLNAGGYPVTWTTSGNGLYFASGTATTTLKCQASGLSG
jgi:hypothetical protein